MKQRATYSIDIENQDIVVRLDARAVDQDSLVKFLDYLELEAIRKRSKLTDKQAALLAKEIDRSAWESMKPDFVRE